MKKKKVFVYQDSDHGDIYVFDSFDKAVECLKEHWGDDHEPEWEILDEGVWHDLMSDYVTIYEKEVL